MYTLHKISRGILISTFVLNNLTWYVQKKHTKGRSISFSGNLFIPRFLHRRVYGSLKWSCNFVSSFSFVLSCFATEPWFSERCLKMQICYLFYKEIGLIANKINKYTNTRHLGEDANIYISLVKCRLFCCGNNSVQSFSHSTLIYNPKTI